MGLKDTFKSAANTIFTAVGDIATEGWYHHMGSTVYDASSGTASVIENRYIVSFVFSQYKSNQVDNKMIKPRDIQALCQQSSLPIVPVIHDRILRLEANATVTYEVVDIEADAADATWKIQLRKPG